MTDKEFEKQIADALRSHTEEPPADMLQRIEDTLADTTAKRARIHILRYIAIAAALLAAVTTALYLVRPLPDEMPVAQNGQPAAQHSKTLIAEPPVPHPVTIAENTPATRTVDTRYDIRTTPYTPATAAETPTIATTSTETEYAAVPKRTTTLPEHSVRIQKYHAVSEDSPRSSAAERGTYDNRTATSTQRNSVIARKEQNRKHRTRRISASLYAGNTGVGSNSYSNNPAVAAGYDMLLQQQADASIGNSQMINEDSGRPLGIPAGYDTESIELRHRMPLNIGFTLAIPINDRLAITTGINYSYLYSSTTQSFAYGTGSVTRELHYIGIPIGIAYTFFRTGDFGFYVQGGAMAEKGIAWRETYTLANSNDRSSTHEQHNIKGIQFSVNASAGISYDLSRHFALYVEPGVSYYFSNTSQPASYRTAHPTNFNIKIGLRFGI